MKKLLSIFALLIFPSIAALASEDPTILINNKTFLQAFEAGEIIPSYRTEMNFDEGLTIPAGMQIPCKKILHSYRLETTGKPKATFTFNTKVSGNDHTYSFTEVGDTPIFSNVSYEAAGGTEILLPHDLLALHLLENNKFISGLECSRVTEEWHYKVSASSCIKQAPGVINCTGPIELKSKIIELAGTWFRSPTGVKLCPTKSIKSTIKEIRIKPWIHMYRFNREIRQSWTTFVTGKVDFTNSILDLTVQNATVEVYFNKNVLHNK